MSDVSRYFDSAATTPLDPRVRQAMLPYLADDFGNANSLHSFGRKAQEAVEAARISVANLIGAEDPSQVFFTSGATEANNWIVRSFESGITSPFEHSSLLEPARSLGWSIQRIDEAAVSGSFQIASLMAVNNETGTIWDVRNTQAAGALLHSDVTQAIGKIPYSVEGLSFASMSAHKLYGPKGIGALYCSEQPPSPLLIGGEQEHGFRSGTLNVPAIVGFGEAARIAQDELEGNLLKVTDFRSAFLAELSNLAEFEILGGSKTSPYILNVAFPKVEGETLVIETDRAGYAISSGAACSSRSTEPSHVLLAMGVDPSLIRGSVRISFTKYNSMENCLGLARTLAHSVEKLRTFTMGQASSRNAEQGNARL